MSNGLNIIIGNPIDTVLELIGTNHIGTGYTILVPVLVSAHYLFIVPNELNFYQDIFKKEFCLEQPNKAVPASVIQSVPPVWYQTKSAYISIRS